MASSRVPATNENVSTFGGAGQGRDYTSVATWEAATDINLVTAAQSEVLECYDDEATFDEAMTISGATTNASYHRIIRPAGTKYQSDWQGHDGTPNNGVHFEITTGDDALRMAEDYLQIWDLIISFDITESSSYELIKFDNDNTEMKCIGVIAGPLINASTGRNRCFEFQTVSGDTCYAINCIAIEAQNGGEGFQMGDPGTVILSNCTAIDCDAYGFEQDGGTVIAKNCLATGSGTNDFQGTYDAASTNNASGDATAPGGSARINQTFTFRNAAADDYHLDINDAGARDFGADLSADGNFAFDDDIDWRLRVGDWDWDIGADEYFSLYPIISDLNARNLIFGQRIAR